MRPEMEQELAHVLLTELLAFQFASPVRWIETQDVFLKDFNTERVVEIGPSPTLAGMASRTIKGKYESYDAALSLQRQVLCYAKDAKEIYYTPDPVEPPAETPAEPAAAAAPAAPAAAAAAPVAAPAASAAPAVAAAEIPDEPVKAKEIIHALIAQKLKKPLEQVPMSKAIKDLVGGKSTVQNEILGDLGKEFGATPEKPEETPLDELAENFQHTFSGSLGKQSSSLVSRLMSSKMPGGFNLTSAKKYIESRWGLGPGRQDSVFLIAVTMEPPARLPSEADAKAFLDSVVQKYAAGAGISLAAAASAGAGAAGGAGAIAIDSEALEAMTKEQKELVRKQLELYANYLEIDLRAGDKKLIQEKESSAKLQSELDLWNEEHGDFYAAGIKPSFSALKARTYDSYWNWTKQDMLSMFYDIVFGKLTNVDREIVAQCIQIMNRANPNSIEFMQYYIDHCPTDKGENYKLAKRLGQQLIDNCKQVLGQDPVYKDITYPTGPKTSIDAKGNITYEEVPRPSVRKLEQYVCEMAAGGEVSRTKNAPSIEEDLAKVYKTIARQNELTKEAKLKIKTMYSELVKFLEENGEIATKTPVLDDEGTDDADSSSSDSDSTTEVRGLTATATKTNKVSSKVKPDVVPFLHLKRKSVASWEYDKSLTGMYLDNLENVAINGVTFKDKYVLITGAGAGSIGADILQGLISGGAKVIVTTSRFSQKVTKYYQSMYTRYGSAGSALIVVPFNQGSKKDVDDLVSYIYDEKNGLGWDLDFVIPFAAIPEQGIEIDQIDSKSELAHRIMLTNLLRLLGNVKKQKAARAIETRPAQVILPLSPNHGTFGSDGLYSESKIALETLFDRWHSESWGSYLTICGAIIGWTRGTGLMSANNIVAEGIEKYGVRTFSQKEMAFNILGLMVPDLVNQCQREPVMADLNGGFQFLPNMRELLQNLRADMNQTSEIRKAVSIENSIEYKVVNGNKADAPFQVAKVERRANMKMEFPTLKSYDELKKIAPEMEGMLDLDSTVVITGFAEVGPWGNARTRWEMEAYGEFSLEGCIEMAWIMGLIKYHNGKLKGVPYVGWVDSKTQTPVDDKDIKAKYEAKILAHTGIRLIEPELFNGYDPNRKELIQEVVIDHDLEPFEASKETAEQFKLQHGDKAEIFEIPGSGEYTVRLLSGAKLFIPKALRFDRLVAGQIPTGWDARTYGIGEDIISQVDPVTLYSLVSVVEALVSSGITDPYEFYQYVHVSEVGNCSGSGMGGVSALRGMFKDRYQDKPVQNDILQESFINTMSAWVNMLLLSSSGPIKTPVAACATAVESVDVGVETILCKKAKICIVGGCDDFQEEGSYEFANMNATSNSVEEEARGRTPSEMSRPTTTTRAGFMEAQGAGNQIIMTARLALQMGVPIYGVIALSATASDKIGRSVPAPGKGILTTAREHQGDLKYPVPSLNIRYRKRQIAKRKQQIKQWAESEYLYVQEEAELMKEEHGDNFDMDAYLKERAAFIETEVAKQTSEAVRTWGNDFWKSDARIAPLRGALATFGLTIDDLGVASFHGTSTKANDKNESQAINQMLTHLGRTPGNPILGVFQKYLTGHPKGAAGAWMLNGVLQILNSGIVPGNRNADNVDSVLEQFTHILFPSRTIKTDGIKAASVTSFGFGQKGAQAIVVHSDYLFASLDADTYHSYAKKVGERYKKTYRYAHQAFINNSLFVAKDKSPYTDELEQPVYLDPLVRVSQDKKTKNLVFEAKHIQESKAYLSKKHTKATEEMLKKLTADTATGAGSVGVDVEEISAINIDNETFLERNFTAAERAYCAKAPSPQASFAGTWSAKEAVFKSLNAKSKGAGAALAAIEIVRDANGAPAVVLHGEAEKAANAAGISSVKVSISHDDTQAVAVAISQ